MKQVNLKEHRNFWLDFCARGSAFDPSAMITAEQFERWMLEWYGVDCRVEVNNWLWTATMSDEEYTAFLLRWS